MEKPGNVDDEVLAVLAAATEPLSGRRVAELTHRAPSTTNAALRRLADSGAAEARKSGRATLWEVTNEGLARMSGGNGPWLPRLTVLILTALPLEFAAVATRLNSPTRQRSQSGIRYLEADFVGDHIEWMVILAEVGMGIAASASSASSLAREINADLLLFVGIAGGLKDDLVHGDVVVADYVLNVNQGKLTESSDGTSQFLPRTTTHAAPAALAQLARQIGRIDGIGIGGSPNVFVRPVASGEAVLAARDPKMSNYTQCFAIDMESFGLMQVGHDLRLAAIAIRGISDFVLDKTSAADQDRQPLAARNAASVAMTLLRTAEPSDVGARSAIVNAPSQPETVRPAGGRSEPWQSSLGGGAKDRIPAGARIWLDALGEVDPALRIDAEGDLSDATPVGTRLGRALHRPPRWIRHDPTATGWILLASLAEHEDLRDPALTQKIIDVYERAAEAARHACEPRLATWLSFMAEFRRQARQHPTGSQEAAHHLRQFDLGVAPELFPIVDFYASLFTGLDEDIRRTAPAALMATGYVVPISLRVLWPQEQWFTADIGLPERIGQTIQVNVLITTATSWLQQDAGEPALRAAEEALRIRPAHQLAALRRAQAQLAVLHTDGHSAAHDTSRTLRDIERSALAVRDEQQRWRTDSSEAVALAARARFEAGDPDGALVLLLPPPRGSAHSKEASSPEVQRWIAHIAAAIGDNETALRAASQLPDGEGDLVRGDVYARQPGKQEQAISGFRAALDRPDAQDHVTYSALLGLARLGVGLDDAGIAPHVQRVVAQDPAAADFLRATAALAQGNHDDALRIIRPHRTTMHATELEARALVAKGKPEAAVERYDKFGTAIGDSAIRMQAVRLAMNNELYDEAHRIADAVIAADSGALRRDAREAKAFAARVTGDWDHVETQLTALLDESRNSDTVLAAVPETEARWRWQRIEALHHLRRSQEAFETLMASTTSRTSTSVLTPENAQQALLALSVTSQIVTEHPTKVGDNFFDWLLTITANFISDEQVAAAAIALILRAPTQATADQMQRAHDLIEDYFTRYEETGSIRRLTVLDDHGELKLDELEQMLREQAESRTETITELTRQHLAGRLPLSVFTRPTGRSYTELLITRVMGCYVVEPDSDEARSERLRHAVEAIGAGQIVVDTSALIVGPQLGLARLAMVALFDRVLIPASLRDDALQARTSLSLRSAGSMGWNPVTESLQLTEHDPATTETWCAAASDLVSDIRKLELRSDAKSAPPFSAESGLRLPALQLAQASNVPLWADDAGLIGLASALGIPAFGSADLIRAAAQSKLFPADLTDALEARQREARIVDLPVTRPWHEMAADENWDPSGYTGLMVSRASAWGDVPSAFRQYMALIRAVQLHAPPETVMGWALRSGHGLAVATEAAARLLNRATVVAPMIAWTALNTDSCLSVDAIIGTIRPQRRVISTEHPVTRDLPASPTNERTLPILIKLAEDLEFQYMPGARLVEHTIAVIADTLRSVASSGSAARMVATALDSLTEPSRSRAMAALLSSPPVDASRLETPRPINRR